jgi:carboxypeptidase PM20D1
MLKRVALLTAGLIVALLALMAGRASSVKSRQPATGEPPRIEVDLDAVSARFAEALTYRTISHQEIGERRPEAFLAFHQFLARSFPRVHAALRRETVSELSLLFTWDGADPSLDPVLLMGHLDVVPVIPGTESSWEHPPFGGVIADGWIWGRGALDDKASVMGILEAVEHLLAEGFRPRHTVYLAFGHDEEIGGPEGAGRVAATLARRGVEPYVLVLDEGGFVGSGERFGVEPMVAVIGIAEKGFVTLELVVDGAGGHSSAPPPSTSLGILSKAVTRLEESQFPARLDGATAAMLGYLAPETPFLGRMVLANLWMTRHLVETRMLRDPSAAAMLRTTTAVTIMQGGVKENVLPIAARAVVNHRIRPGETVESVTARVREVIGDDRVRVTPTPGHVDPSPVSDPGSEAFALVARTLLEVLPDEEVIVAPYLVIGGTDAKYYSGRSESVFRFLPVVGDDDILQRLHGTNERISLDSLELAVRYFVHLIRGSDALG